MCRRATGDRGLSRFIRRPALLVSYPSVGRTVEVRGTAQFVVILADGRDPAEHARNSAERLVLLSAHYEEESTPAGARHRRRWVVARSYSLGSRAGLGTQGRETGLKGGA